MQKGSGKEVETRRTMNEDERLYEQYEDAFFALLLNKVAEADGKELMQKNEALLADPDAAVPARLRRRCLHTIEKSHRKAQIQRAARKTLRTLNRVALWILIPLFLFGGVFAASEAVRLKTLNFLIEEFDVGTTFSFYQNNTQPDDTAAWPADYVRSCVPANFSFVYANNDSTSSAYIFINEANNEISISEYFVHDKDAAVSVDTENADVSEMRIGSQLVYMIEADDAYQIVWVAEEAQKMIVIGGPRSLEDTVMEIAKNLISGKS